MTTTHSLSDDTRPRGTHGLNTRACFRPCEHQSKILKFFNKSHDLTTWSCGRVSPCILFKASFFYIFFFFLLFPSYPKQSYFIQFYALFIFIFIVSYFYFILLCTVILLFYRLFFLCFYFIYFCLYYYQYARKYVFHLESLTISDFIISTNSSKFKVVSLLFLHYFAYFCLYLFVH